VRASRSASERRTGDCERVQLHWSRGVLSLDPPFCAGVASRRARQAASRPGGHRLFGLWWFPPGRCAPWGDGAPQATGLRGPIPPRPDDPDEHLAITQNGGSRLRAGVLADGGARATINRDGSISAKVGWWVRDVARLSIVGRRLDRPAPPLRARIPFGYGPQSDIGASVGFQPSGLTFPTVGCWRVVGRAGSAGLTFVVRVTTVK